MGDDVIVDGRANLDLLQREIAERIGCSQMHVPRILKGAIRRLQEAAAADR